MKLSTASIIQRELENPTLHQITDIDTVVEEGETGFLFSLNTGQTLHPIFPLRDYKEPKYPRELERAKSATIHTVLCEYYVRNNESFDALIGKIVCARIEDVNYQYSKHRRRKPPLLQFSSGHSIDFVKSLHLQLNAHLHADDGGFRPFLTDLPVYALLAFMGKTQVDDTTLRLDNEYAHIHVHRVGAGISTLVYDPSRKSNFLTEENIHSVFEQHYLKPGQDDYYMVNGRLEPNTRAFYLAPRDRPCLIMEKAREEYVSNKMTTSDDYDKVVHNVSAILGMQLTNKDYRHENETRTGIGHELSNNYTWP